MTDYRKMILDEVLKNPIYRDSIKALSKEQVGQIEEHLVKFVDSFGMTLIKAASAARANREVSDEVTKALEKIDGGVFSGSKDK